MLVHCDVNLNEFFANIWEFDLLLTVQRYFCSQFDDWHSCILNIIDIMHPRRFLWLQFMRNFRQEIDVSCICFDWNIDITPGKAQFCHMRAVNADDSVALHFLCDELNLVDDVFL